MTQTILEYIKAVLAIEQEEDGWNEEILMILNSIVSFVSQLGFDFFDENEIIDETTTWPDFSANPRAGTLIRALFGNKTKLVFDPPANQTVKSAREAYVLELESRLMLL